MFYIIDNFNGNDFYTNIVRDFTDVENYDSAPKGSSKNIIEKKKC